MITDLAAEVLGRIGHTWIMRNTSGTIWDGPKFFKPTQDDVARVLDRAVETLYSEEVGTRLSTGGLIIEKAPEGYDVYVYLGNHEGES